MIYIDDRERVKGFSFKDHLTPSKLEHLEYGDFFWKGLGPKGRVLNVGVERKTIMDLIQSMCSGRLSGHQIPGLQKEYDIIYLLVEGIWRINPVSGLLETLKGKSWKVLRFHRTFTGGEVLNYLNTLDVVCGFRIRESSSPHRSARFIQATYHWWTKKGFDKHRSQMSIKKPYMGGPLTKPSTLKVMAACLPGIGHEKADLVSKEFKSPRAMCNASREDWMEIDGIGPGTAKKVCDVITGRTKR